MYHWHDIVHVHVDVHVTLPRPRFSYHSLFMHTYCALWSCLLAFFHLHIHVSVLLVSLLEMLQIRLLRVISSRKFVDLTQPLMLLIYVVSSQMVLHSLECLLSTNLSC